MTSLEKLEILYEFLMRRLRDETPIRDHTLTMDNNPPHRSQSHKTLAA